MEEYYNPYNEKNTEINDENINILLSNYIKEHLFIGPM